MQPRLLDLFCGAGGATKGYQNAGFHVTGVDIKPQKHYCGDEFYQGDALEILMDLAVGWTSKFDAIHASPPCQAYSMLRQVHPSLEYPDLIEATRDLLNQTGLLYVIENVTGSPLNPTVILCGSMFGLGSGERQLRRHRLFETNFPMLQPECQHEGYSLGVYGHGSWENNVSRPEQETRRGGYQGTKAEKAEAMGIDWMTNDELTQAIPPAYTEFVGQQMLAQIRVAA